MCGDQTRRYSAPDGDCRKAGDGEGLGAGRSVVSSIRPVRGSGGKRE